MRKSTLVIVVFAVLLVVSNAYWLYQMVDAGVSYSYLADSYYNAQATSEQALLLLPEVAKPEASRESILNAAIAAVPGVDPFEKDGYIWIDAIGLHFDAGGRLVDVQPSVEILD